MQCHNSQPLSQLVLQIRYVFILLEIHNSIVSSNIHNENLESNEHFQHLALWLLFCIKLRSSIRASLYYDRGLRDRQFSRMRLQETKNLASRSFTLKAKVQGPLFFMAILFDLSFHQSDGLSKEI